MENKVLKNRKQILHFCSCGYAKCKPLHSNGPMIWPHYRICYIVKGRGMYRVGKKMYELEAGEGFVIEPGTIISYESDEEDPWSCLWIEFFGSEAAEYLKEMGVYGDYLVFRANKGEELTKTIENMLKNTTSSMLDRFRRKSLLYEFFWILAEDLEVKQRKNSRNENVYIREAMEFIHMNYFHPMKVSRLAKYLGINRSYLYTLFKTHIGISPQEYLTKCRNIRAKELLLHSELPIEGVAHSCGYIDPLVFSKMFKVQNGMPPSMFRKINGQKTQVTI